jgi:hypothetical protein
MDGVVLILAVFLVNTPFKLWDMTEFRFLGLGGRGSNDIVPLDTLVVVSLWFDLGHDVHGTASWVGI